MRCIRSADDKPSARGRCDGIRRYGDPRMKKAVLIALVVVLVLLGLPLPVPGMGPIDCGDCDQAPLVHAMCFAIVGLGLILLVALALESLTMDRRRILGLLLANRLERPPRLA